MGAKRHNKSDCNTCKNNMFCSTMTSNLNCEAYSHYDNECDYVGTDSNETGEVVVELVNG